MGFRGEFTAASLKLSPVLPSVTSRVGFRGEFTAASLKPSLGAFVYEKSFVVSAVNSPRPH